MFSKQTRNWIKDYTKDVYLEDLDLAIDSFENALRLKAPTSMLTGIPDLLPKYLEDIATAPDISVTRKELENISKIEQYLKFIFLHIDPLRSQNPPQQVNSRQWTLMPLLKEGLRVVPLNQNLSHLEPTDPSFPYREQYLIAYDIRNHNSHDFEIMSQKEVFEAITAILTVYLDVSYRYRTDITKLVENVEIQNTFSVNQYCKNIISEYERIEENGFTYVDICWANSEMANPQSCRIEDFLNNNDCHYIRLLGEAGCGKTTALLRLQYLAAKRKLEKTSSKIPVYIALIDFEKDSSVEPELISAIQQRLKVKRDTCIKMLKKNKITLYLDGFNEILDINRKKRFVWSVEDFQETYPDICIYLTDRSMTKSYISILDMSQDYHLYPLTLEMKKDFILGNCRDKEAQQILITAAKEKPGYFDEFDTPIRLKHLIQITSKMKKLCDDPFGDYIEYLFERERLEKKDENVEYLHRFAQALSLIDKSEFSVLEAEKCLAHCKRELGYTTPDTRKCLNLLIEMGLLCCENNSIYFSQQEFQSYFWVTAMTENLDEILGIQTGVES